jgi:hypothetical protein
MFIPDPGPDFFFFHPESGSPIQGSKKHWIPDPQHWIFHSLDVVSPWTMDLSPMRPDHIYI